MLKMTAVCNAGIYVEYQDSGLLIDGIASDYLGFTGLTEELYRQALGREALFRNLCGICFTHTHPDHCSPELVRQLHQRQPQLTVLQPDEKTPPKGCIQCGPFSVSYMETPHMPHTFEQVRHFVLLIHAGNETVYVAADAMIDAELHRTVLHDVNPDYIVINPVYLTVPSMVSFLAEKNPKAIFVYHIPADADDQTGMRRKAERSIKRCCDQLPPITLAAHHPQRLL